jgi:hypothetical protein
MDTARQGAVPETGNPAFAHGTAKAQERSRAAASQNGCRERKTGKNLLPIGAYRPFGRMYLVASRLKSPPLSDFAVFDPVPVPPLGSRERSLRPPRAIFELGGPAQTRPTNQQETIEMLNLAIVLTENAQRFPERTAVIADDHKLSYGELDAITNRLADSLVRLGVHPGQKLLIMLPNIPEFVVAYFGILKTGGVVVPINVLYKAR